MTATFTLLHDNIDLQTDENCHQAQSASLHYLLESDEPLTDEQVLALARDPESGIRKTYLNMRLMAFNITQRITGTRWKLNASYQYFKHSLSTGNKVPDESVTYDFSTSSELMRVSRGTVRTYGNTPDLKGAINFQPGDEEPKGVQVVMPTATMSIRKYFTPARFSVKLRNKIAYRIGRVNGDTFRGFERGELLFLGASVSRQGTGSKDLWVVNYKFGISENDDDVKVPGFDEKIAKEGWQYIWPRFGMDRSRGTYLIGPVGVYVEKIYKYADFSEMGLSARP